MSLPRGKIRWDGLPSDTEETAAVIIFKKFPILEIKLDIFKEQTNEIVSQAEAQSAILSTLGLAPLNLNRVLRAGKHKTLLIFREL